jgi:hypothetical protein
VLGWIWNGFWLVVWVGYALLMVAVALYFGRQLRNPPAGESRLRLWICAGCFVVAALSFWLCTLDDLKLLPPAVSAAWRGLTLRSAR